jgi:hypothetical protein
MKRKFLLFVLLGLSFHALAQLGIPTQVSPSSGATYYVGTTINFSWTSVTDAVSYDVEFDPGTGYVSLSNVVGTGLSIPQVASNTGPHTWHVRAKSAAATGDYSSSQTYTVIGVPGVPVTVSPTTNSNVTYNTATNFTWNTIANATGYKIQFDSDPPIVVAGNSYPNTFTVLGNHTWKVLASNPAGESAWSSSKNIIVVLGIPNQTSPANNNLTYTGSTINFSWTPVSGATSYDLELDAGLGFASLTNVVGTSKNLLLTTGDVGPHTWHIRAKNGANIGSWSASRTYTVVGVPATPTTNNPPSGSDVTYSAPTFFSWNQVANATSYSIQYDSEAPITVTGTNYSRTFSTFGSHTWKVLASNDAGDSGWSSVKTFNVVLAAPPLNSPTNGSTSYVGTTLGFSWTSIPGATSYDIEFDAGLGSATLTNVASVTYQQVLSNASIGQHTWHVRAKSGSNIGPWSQSRTYIVAGVPGTPVLTAPATESTITYEVATTFTWNPVQFATTYQIQFDSEAPLTLSNNSYARTFSAFGSHSWKVKAINPAGESSWSTVYNFTVILGVPILSSPANNASDYVGATASFSWSSVAGATSYDLEFDSGLGTVTLTNILGISTNLVLIPSYAGVHTWHVRAKNGALVGAWSSSRNFTIIGIPGVPVTTSPATASSIFYDNATNFTWNAVPNATSYKIQFDSESPITVTGTSYTRTYSAFGSHTWKVLASNDAGDSGWSSSKTFTVNLGVPALSSPSNQATSYVGTLLNFTWTSVAGATSYDIEFDAGLGSASLTNEIVTSKQWALVAANVGNHTWHVRARNGSTIGTWSASRTFTVAGLPGIPVTLNPPNDGTVIYNSQATFIWNPVTNATSYLIQFDSEAPIPVSGASFQRTFNTLTSHTWTVKAVNPAGESGWSTVKSFTVILGTPNLSSPANASTFYVGSTIEFSWTSVAGATSYDVEFDAGLGYVYSTNVSTTTFNMPLILTNVGPHTWHVRAKLNSTSGNWSANRTYVVAGIPAIPVTVSPANGSSVTSDQNVTFNWNSVPTATSYKIQFDAEDPIIVSGTTYMRTFSTLGNHTWMVLASNDAGDSGWSSPKTFTVELGAPVLTNPANSAIFFVGSTIDFSWTPITGATSYDVEFDAGMGYVSTVNVTSASLSQVLGNINAGPHTWHVRAKFNSVVGAWSASRTYQVVGIPTVPVLTKPADGAIFPYETPIVFTWNAITGASGYQIQFDTETAINVSGTSYTRSFSTQANHTWKVLAVNSAGNSSWSNTSKFALELGAPTLSAPADAASFNAGSTINFTWSVIPGATSYDIEFDNGTPNAILTSVNVANLSLLTTVPMGGSHTWRVCARQNTITGAWSSVRTYAIITIPSIPVLVTPPQNESVAYNATINFTWNAVSGATGYKIQFDNETPLVLTGTSYSRSFTTLGLHTWKVLASNGAGESGWSIPGLLTIEFGKPTLISPANAFNYFAGSFINFSWTVVNGAESYDLEIDAGTPFASIINVVGTSYSKTADALAAGTHTWHVRAKLGASLSVWSATQSYSITGVPSVPGLISPASGITVYGETVINFTWNASANAASYQIQFDAEAPVFVTGTTYSRAFSTAGMHSWKVLAVNAAGSSPWSNANTFTMELGAPTLSAPADATTFNVGSTINFTWSSIPGATSYDVEFDNGMPNATITSVNVANLNLLTTATMAGSHTWRVRSKQNTTAGAWSASQTYSVMGAPSVPGLIGPASGITIYSETVTDFNWNTATNAASYQIQFDTEAPVIVAGTTYSRAFSAAGLHSWKVLATNASGNSDWSAVRTFTVVTDIPVIKTKVLTVTPDNTLNLGTVTVNNSNSKTIELLNSGNSVLKVTSVTLTGANADQFNLSGSSGTSFDIAAGATVKLTISFTPTSAGLKNASLTIANNSDNAQPSKIITLSGTGTLLPTRTLTVDPDVQFDFGNLNVNSFADKIFTLQNNGTASISFTGIALSGLNSDQFTILNAINNFDLEAGGNRQITIRFKPLSAGVKSALLMMSNNADNASPSKQITLSGSGIAQQIFALPTVVTTTISGVSSNAATSGGNVTSDGNAAVTAKGICWSKAENPIITDSRTIDGTGIGSYVSAISGLTPGTVYHVRAYATNSVGTSYGPDIQFTTLALATVTTTVVTSVTSTSAVGGGEIKSDGGTAILARGLCWSKSDSPTINDSKTSDGTDTGSFVSNISGLSSGVTYHVRAYVTNSVGTSYGTDITFTTQALATVTTSSAIATSATAATGGGNVSADGGATVTTRGSCWSKNGNPTILDAKTNDGSGTGTFTSAISGLSAGTTYHTRAYATNAVGTSYGADVLFTTPSQATVSTISAVATSSTTALGKGDIISDGGTPVIQKGFCWAVNINPTTADAKTANGTGLGSFSDIINGLNQGTTYHVRAYATNMIGTSYGADIQFTTPSLATVVTSSVAPSENSSTTGVCKGNVTNDGGASVTEKGFCWSLNANPTIGDSRTTDGTGLGTFSDILSGLTPGTVYHVRAYATNAVGSAYGADMTFETTVNNGIFNISSFYQIYPNPSHGRITIRVKENIPVDMSLFTLEGVLIQNQKLLNLETVLDLNLPKGIYLIELKSDKVNGSYKIVIQ